MAALLGTAKPQLMVTDPPYGVNYDPAWRHRRGRQQFQPAPARCKNDERADWGAAWKLFPGNIAYVWHARCKPRPLPTA